MTYEMKSIINNLMAKELSEKEIPIILASLEKEKHRNLFFINNLRTLELGKAYRIFKVSEAYVMNFMSTAILIWCEVPYDVDQMIAFLSSQSFVGLNGPAECIMPLSEHFSQKGFRVDLRKMLMCDKSTFKKVSPRDDSLRYLLSPEDFEDLYDLYMRCPEYREGMQAKDREEFALDMAEKEYPFAAAGLYDGKKLVSAGYLSAYTKESAMIVSVATDPEYRNRGCATKAVSELIDIALNENLIGYLCLWYSTPEARRVYEKLGFVELGGYAYIHK